MTDREDTPTVAAPVDEEEAVVAERVTMAEAQRILEEARRLAAQPSNGGWLADIRAGYALMQQTRRDINDMDDEAPSC